MQFSEDARAKSHEGHDSQIDSQTRGRGRFVADVSGHVMAAFDLRRMSANDDGRRIHGLQNRLRGAAEASWGLGSIPIHPRQILVLTAKLTTTARHMAGVGVPPRTHAVSDQLVAAILMPHRTRP